MHAFWHRYEIDTSRPDGRQVRRDLVRRVLLPAAALWCVVVGTGLLVTGPLGGLPAEASINEWFVTQRTPALDAVTTVLSAIGQTEFLIGACLLAMALIWWRTRQWWYAIIPGLAVAVQAVIFLTSALVVGRERPEVEHLDHAPPTSSFPSGHTGAATAFYLTMAFGAQRITHPVARWAATVLCVLVPVAVGVARTYRGMHSLSDVVVGFLNGATCAVIAWNYLRRTT
ncbi:phosphatase PAP2 family protein [Cellulomonas wangsupingiae]|uniref:Phosphatase PAP2 family protein n=1 Tax=Cellulomonas wangsupingiae TaxID=2968085 RepID=A0ABY5K2U9_9CELL|nr:phosphatase PAP2 family protein [Cellulomonas wangsupingiae]MCC2333563.1 phosphatase PAP2 family protein [Cellulomonas wangsupingiae]MCM0638413.1 phosphatase PAP2 family protein [Cellulomonas wangsupingiae]UUI63746.1 phosphatase PAP2 family protein [Cellulomonas wangsupingiae]